MSNFHAVIADTYASKDGDQLPHLRVIAAAETASGTGSDFLLVTIVHDKLYRRE